MLCGLCVCACEGAGRGEGHNLYLPTLLIANVIQHKTPDTNEGKQKYWACNVSQCHFVHHKSLMDWPGIDGRRLRATDKTTPALTLFANAPKNGFLDELVE